MDAATIHWRQFATDFGEVTMVGDYSRLTPCLMNLLML